MPDDEFKSPEELEKGAETEVRKRVKSVSGVSDAISQMKLDVEKRAGEIKKIGREEGIAEVSGSVSKVLSKLGDTIGALTLGIKNITVSTARSTKEAVSQYGRAISEDISFNKRNIIAMSLSRATPLFGYFAAKFMETDVFKNMAQKIKEKIGGALSTVATKFSGMVSSAWGRARDFVSGIASKATSVFKREKEKPTKRPMTAESRITSEVNERLKAIESKIPKMQRGGLVERGGLAEVHAGEIVAPIDKVLDKLDESRAFATEVVQSLVSSIHGMSRRGMKLEAYVATESQRRKGLLRGFLHAYEQSWKRHEAPANVRMLRAMLELKTSMIGETNRWRFIWQKMMYEHPVLRSAIFMLRGFRRAIEFPFRFMFRARGGYIGQLPSSRNMFYNMTQVLGMIYATGMWKLDQMLEILRAGAAAQRDLSTSITGIPYPAIPGIGKGRWSIAKKMIRAIAWPIEYAVKKMAPEEAAEKWTTKKYGFFPKWYKPIGYKEEDTYLLKKTSEGVTKLVRATDKTLLIEDRKWRSEKKKLGLQQRMAEGISGMRKRLTKLGSQVWKYIMMFMGFMRAMVGSFVGLIKTLGIRVIIPAVMSVLKSKTIRDLFGGLAKRMGSLLGGPVKGLIGKLGAFVPTKVGAAARGLGGLAARFAGPLALAYGGYEMAAGGVRGYKKAEEWETGKAAATVGGVLGGTKKGWRGAVGGAAKGAAIGFGLGTVVPVIGNAMGAIVGGLVGAILGFVGGENIAKGISYAWNKIKPYATKALDIIFYPFKMIGRLVKRFWDWITGKRDENEKKAKEAADNTTGVIDRICNFMKDFGKKIGRWMEEKVKKIPGIGTLYGKIKGLFTGEEKITEKPVRSVAEAFDKMAGVPGAISEKTPETIAKATEIAKVQAKEAAIRAKALTKPLMEMQEKAMEKAKEERGSMTNFITNVTNVISSSMQSLTSALGGERKGQFDPEMDRLLSGGLF